MGDRLGTQGVEDNFVLGAGAAHWDCRLMGWRNPPLGCLNWTKQSSLFSNS